MSFSLPNPEQVASSLFPLFWLFQIGLLYNAVVIFLKRPCCFPRSYGTVEFSAHFHYTVTQLYVRHRSMKLVPICMYNISLIALDVAVSYNTALTETKYLLSFCCLHMNSIEFGAETIHILLFVSVRNFNSLGEILKN